MEAQRYQVIQDGKEYILSTQVLPNIVRIECQDINTPNKPVFLKDYKINDLQRVSDVFKYSQSNLEIQQELNRAIESQKVSISPGQDNLMEVTFNVANNNSSEEIAFPLPIGEEVRYRTASPQQATYPQAAVTYDQQNIYPQAAANYSQYYSMKAPIYKDVHVPTVEMGSNNYQVKSPTVEMQKPVTYAPQTPYGINVCPLDHERIDRLENDGALLKNEHLELKNRVNALRARVEAIKKQAGFIKSQNDILNAKTLNLKQAYNNLIEGETVVRAENDRLKRENQELQLKKNQVDFYSTEHNDVDTVKEVNIPFDPKRTRPTNVSKRDRYGGYGGGQGGYSSLDMQPAGGQTYNFPQTGYSSFDQQGGINTYNNPQPAYSSLDIQPVYK